MTSFNVQCQDYYLLGTFRFEHQSKRVFDVCFTIETTSIVLAGEMFRKRSFLVFFYFREKSLPIRHFFIPELTEICDFQLPLFLRIFINRKSIVNFDDSIEKKKKLVRCLTGFVITSMYYIVRPLFHFMQTHVSYYDHSKKTVNIISISN